jgi:hypothetical protein
MNSYKSYNVRLNERSRTSSDQWGVLSRRVVHVSSVKRRDPTLLNSKYHTRISLGTPVFSCGNTGPMKRWTSLDL